MRNRLTCLPDRADKFGLTEAHSVLLSPSSMEDHLDLPVGSRRPFRPNQRRSSETGAQAAEKASCQHLDLNLGEETVDLFGGTHPGSLAHRRRRAGRGPEPQPLFHRPPRASAMASPATIASPEPTALFRPTLGGTTRQTLSPWTQTAPCAPMERMTVFTGSPAPAPPERSPGDREASGRATAPPRRHSA